MGNQPSRIIEKTKRNRPKQGRRRSTISHRSTPASLNFRPERRPSAAAIVPPPTHYVKRRKPSSVKSPEDLREFDRLQRQHYLLKSARSTNCCAVEKMDKLPETILDVGTGNGIWAYEMAMSYPSSRVIGIGLRSVSEQPGRPNNLEYIQADLLQPWALESDSIDLIFQRSLGPTTTTEQWQHLLSESLRVLKPGGYIEWVESDVMHHRPGPIQEAFDQFVQQEWDAKGMDFYYTNSLDQMIESKPTLELVDHLTWDIPIGEWHDEIHGKQLGFINQDIQKASYRNKKAYYTVAWCMTSEDYDAAVQALLLEFEDYKSYSRFHCWLARKRSDNPATPTSTK